MAEAAPSKRADPPLPRWSLVLVCAIHAGVFAWAAATLPWHGGTPFAITAAALAIVHALTALMAALRAGALAPVWRTLSAVSLVFLAWCLWQVIATATYVATLYGTLGRGIAAALGIALAVVVLFTLPVACWGLACTKWRASPRRAALAALLAGTLAAACLWRSGAEARTRPLPTEGARPIELSAAIAANLPERRRSPTPESGELPSLDPAGPAHCEHPPTGGGRRATLIVRYLAAGAEGVETRTRCLQGDAGRLPAELGTLVGAEALWGPVKIDWIVAARALVPRPFSIEGLELRPGLDGVCLGGRCLMPWQLVLGDQFDAITPLPFIPDFRFGFAPAAVRGALGADAEAGVRALTAIEVVSLVLDRKGQLHRLRRLREPAPALDADRLARAALGAERHVAGAQREDGAFPHALDPVTGRAASGRATLPRQAGTTLAMCELGRDRERVARVARRSLAAMSRFERRSGELSGLVRETGGSWAGLGQNALPLIAFLACREHVGDEFDGLSARLGRLLLALQRADGGFHPGFDLQRARVVPGPVPLFASGQAVFALSLLEKRASHAAAEVGAAGVPSHEEVRDAVERAMNHFAGDYWDHPLRDFFFIEENWHCLAARASLGHHRNDGYERFCLDYAAFHSRYSLDEHSDVSDDFVGGFGFGNLFPPQNTPTAGFGETLAAAMAIKAARGADLAADRRVLERTLRFLVRQQWNEWTCFACARPRRIAGGFSKSMSSPSLRIDYTQHAWSAIGHGAPWLHLPGDDGTAAGAVPAQRPTP